MTGPSDKPLFSLYIRGSSPTLNLPPSGNSASACPRSLPPHNGALLHPQSHPTSRSSQRQPSTPPRGIALHLMDPVGAIRVRVCVIPTYLFITGRLSDSFVRWLAWTCDAIDFFSVSLSVTRLQQQFHKAEASTIVRFFIWPILLLHRPCE